MNNTDTASEFNMNASDILKYLNKVLEAGLVQDPSEVDTSQFINSAPHTVHLLTTEALPYIKGKADKGGIVTLYWDSNQTPEELGVSIPIPAVEGLSKPRVHAAQAEHSKHGGVPITRTKGQVIEGLPNVPEGKLFITSGIAASAAVAQGINHLVAPAAQVRSIEPEGRRSIVLGCFGFVQG